MTTEFKVNVPDELRSRGFAAGLGIGPRPCVLLVDFINGFTNPEMSLGAEMASELQQASRLIAAARNCKIPVLYSTIEFDLPDAADAHVWGKKIGGLKMLMRGSRASAIDERVARQSEELLISKKGASSFFGSNLVAELIRLQVDTVILAGCTTSGCVRATAVDACQFGFRPIVASDAVADRLPEAHEQALKDITLKYGDVLTVTQISHALQSCTGDGE